MKANDYPIQFKDKIDEYLWKEHHILGGCCSSVESMKYAIAREVAEKLTDVLVKKAVEFFDDHLWEYIDVENANCDTFINIDGDKLKENFKKVYREIKYETLDKTN